jgi:mRNA-degrading endonuclease toxin of MazEF toxin-antitoxin module
VRRGEIWRVTGLRGDRLVVIVSADAIAQEYPTVQAAPVYDAPEVRHTMVTVPLNTPQVSGMIKAVDVAPVLKDKLAERVGEVPAHVMDQVTAALRTLFLLEQPRR